MNMKTILVAEDESAIREFININLRLAGYETVEAENGRVAMEKFDEIGDKIDIALLDIMMPEADGIEVCNYIRNKDMTVGIIFLTAKTQEQDKIEGLISGADDYITKPFSTTELIARVEALYRRVSYSKKIISEAANDCITLGNFTLDLKKHVLIKDGKDIELTQIEYQILECFFKQPNTTLPRNVFLEHVWGDEFYGDEKVVDVNIRRLRLKIEDNSSEPDHLITIWGRGYRWVE